MYLDASFGPLVSNSRPERLLGPLAEYQLADGCILSLLKANKAVKLPYFQGLRVFSPLNGQVLWNDGSVSKQCGPGSVWIRGEVQKDNYFYPLENQEFCGVFLYFPSGSLEAQAATCPPDCPIPRPFAELFSDMNEIWDLNETCPYSCELKKMLLQGKVLMVLSKLLNHLQSPKQQGREASSYSLKLKKEDQERIIKARQVLLANMENPPSLRDLALEVGLNELKLKAGFQAEYGTTVYGLLRRERLRRARYLLEEEHVSVSDAAFRVGYTNTSHFSQAFRREYGLLPRTLRS